MSTTSQDPAPKIDATIVAGQQLTIEVTTPDGVVLVGIGHDAWQGERGTVVELGALDRAGKPGELYGEEPGYYFLNPAQEACPVCGAFGEASCEEGGRLIDDHAGRL